MENTETGEIGCYPITGVWRNMASLSQDEYEYQLHIMGWLSVARRMIQVTGTYERSLGMIHLYMQ